MISQEVGDWHLVGTLIPFVEANGAGASPRLLVSPLLKPIMRPA